MGNTISRISTVAGMALLCGLCGWRSVRLALAVNPDDADYRFRIWQSGGQSAELDRALTLNPRYTAAWIAQGLEFETAGDRRRAESSLLRAAEIDRAYLPRWTLANFYLRAGDLPRFWIWIRRAAQMAYHPNALFQLCWRAGSDPREILERAIPPSPVLRRAYLDFLVRADKLDAATLLADELGASADVSDLALFLRYCDALLARKQAAPALNIWNALAEHHVIPYAALDPRAGRSLTNGELATAPLGQGFDWRPVRIDGASVSVNVALREISVSVSGKQPESCDFIEQYVPVEAGTAYRLRFRYRTRDLAARTGMVWSFLDTRTAAAFSILDLPASPDSWNEQTLSFTTPAGCDLLRIMLSYRRPPGSMRAEGAAIFQRFSLDREG